MGAARGQEKNGRKPLQAKTNYESQQQLRNDRTTSRFPQEGKMTKIGEKNGVKKKGVRRIVTCSPSKNEHSVSEWDTSRDTNTHGMGGKE